MNLCSTYRSMKALACLTLLFAGTGSALGQTAFRHTATPASITDNWTRIDHPATNGRSDAILIVSSDYGSSGPYHPRAIGVWYSEGRWTIFNQDRAPMTPNTRFNVLTVARGDRAFVHTADAAATSGHVTTIDHHSLNGKPEASILVTQVYGDSRAYNANPIGVYYHGGHWRIFNQNGTPMPRGASFNVYLNDGTFSMEVASPRWNWYNIDHPSTNDNGAAVVFATQLWTSTYNPHEIGVWYNRNRWAVYNQDRASLPDGAKFNILALSDGAGRPEEESVRTIARSDWLPELQALLMSARIRINNYTPNQHEFNPTGERAFLRPGDSYFAVNAGGRDVRLPIGIDMIEAGPDLRCKTYLNDWNSRSVGVAVAGGRLRASVRFENEGVEIVTNCYNNFCCEGNPFCPGAGCPDYDLDNAVADVDLTLRIERGRLTYRAEPRFTASVGESGDDICVQNFWAFLCDWGVVPRRPERQNLVRETIEDQLRAQLNSPTLRGVLEAALNSAIPVDGYSQISLSASGDIVLRR